MVSMRPALVNTTLDALHCLLVRLISIGSSGRMSVASSGLLLPDRRTSDTFFCSAGDHRYTAKSYAGSSE
jgi:hypothetical protein